MGLGRPVLQSLEDGLCGSVQSTAGRRAPESGFGIVVQELGEDVKRLGPICRSPGPVCRTLDSTCRKSINAQDIEVEPEPEINVQELGVDVHEVRLLPRSREHNCIPLSLAYRRSGPMCMRSRPTCRCTGLMPKFWEPMYNRSEVTCMSLGPLCKSSISALRRLGPVTTSCCHRYSTFGV